MKEGKLLKKQPAASDSRFKAVESKRQGCITSPSKRHSIMAQKRRCMHLTIQGRPQVCQHHGKVPVK